MFQIVVNKISDDSRQTIWCLTSILKMTNFVWAWCSYWCNVWFITLIRPASRVMDPVIKINQNFIILDILTQNSNSLLCTGTTFTLLFNERNQSCWQQKWENYKVVYSGMMDLKSRHWSFRLLGSKLRRFKDKQVVSNF